MSDSLQEQKVDAAFSKQSTVFDEIDEQNSLLLWMRDRVRQEVMSRIQAGARMLELNCGTGLDTLYFAGQGIHVTATDNAAGMIHRLEAKVLTQGMGELVSVKRCSFNHLEQLDHPTPFDYVFSNFGGLNCTDKLDKILGNIDSLLRPGACFTLVIMPRFCPWEVMTLFRGYFKTAFRRFRKGGARARIEGLDFDCYYYDPGYIIRRMPEYELITLKAVALAIPPPYIEHFRERHPRLFAILEKWENRLCDKAPFNRWGDHFIITMRKTQN